MAALGCHGPRPTARKPCRGVAHSSIDTSVVQCESTDLLQKFKKKIQKWTKNMINKLFTTGNEMRGRSLFC